MQTSTLGHERFDGKGHVSDPVNASSLATDKAAFEAALATLVADGASPTQAHVTAANNAYTTLKADIAPAPAQSDLVLSVNTAAIPSRSALRLAVQQLLALLDGNGALTP